MSTTRTTNVARAEYNRALFGGVKPPRSFSSLRREEMHKTAKKKRILARRSMETVAHPVAALGNPIPAKVEGTEVLKNNPVAAAVAVTAAGPSRSPKTTKKVAKKVTKKVTKKAKASAD